MHVRTRLLRESLQRGRATWQRIINGIGKTATRECARFVNLLEDCIYNFSITALKLSARDSLKTDSVRKVTRSGVHFAVDLYR